MLPMSFVVLRNQNGQYEVHVMLIIVHNYGLPLEFHEKKPETKPLESHFFRQTQVTYTCKGPLAYLRLQ